MSRLKKRPPAVKKKVKLSRKKPKRQAKRPSLPKSWQILAENLKRLSQSHQYSLDFLVESLGASKPMLSKYHNGKAFPPPHMLDRFADLYRMSIASLFDLRSAPDKAVHLIANEQNYMDAANARLRSGEWELIKVKK